MFTIIENRDKEFIVTLSISRARLFRWRNSFTDEDRFVVLLDISQFISL